MEQPFLLNPLNLLNLGISNMALYTSASQSDMNAPLTHIRQAAAMAVAQGRTGPVVKTKKPKSVAVVQNETLGEYHFGASEMLRTKYIKTLEVLSENQKEMQMEMKTTKELREMIKLLEEQYKASNFLALKNEIEELKANNEEMKAKMEEMKTKMETSQKQYTDKVRSLKKVRFHADKCVVNSKTRKTEQSNAINQTSNRKSNATFE